MQLYFEWLDVPLWVFLTGALIYLIYLYGTWGQNFFKERGIDGPKPIPFLGTLHNGMQHGVHIADQMVYNEYRHKRIAGTFDGRVPTLMILDPSMIRDLLITGSQDFSNRGAQDFAGRVMERGLPALRDEHWKHVRSLTSYTFTSGRLRLMSGVLQECCRRLSTAFERESKIDENITVKCLYEGFTIDAICSTMFGVDMETQTTLDHDYVLRCREFFTNLFSYKYPGMLFNFVVPHLMPILTRMGIHSYPTPQVEFFDSFTSKLMEDDHKHPESKIDLMANLMTHLIGKDTKLDMTTGHLKWSSKGLSKQEVRSQMVTMILAGYDTTASVLSFVTYFLATNPDVQDKLREDIIAVHKGEEPDYDSIHKVPYLEQVIFETLRICPPVVRFDRIPNKDTFIGDISIPKSTSVAVPVFSLHHDPDYYPEPEKFDPERFTQENIEAREPYTWLPFGDGPRHCIGMRFALVEIKMAMCHLLPRIKFVPCEKTMKTISLCKRPSAMLRTTVPIIVKLEKV